MLALAGPFHIAAVLLLVGGAPKVFEPSATAGALGSVGLPRSETLVRLMGASEAAIGATALTVGGRFAALLVAACYIGFTGFVVAAMARGGAVASCGCFGTDDTPPTAVHLVIDASAAAVAAAAVATPVAGIFGAVGVTPLGGVPFLALVGIGAWFAYLAMSVLPTVVPRGGTR
jgi:Methylamine utilisation protein MauE